MKKESKKKIWLIRLVIFICLLLVGEVGLRLAGFKPKILINWAYMPNEIVNDSILYADEFGISHYVQGKHYKPDSKINDQGFIGHFNYDSITITNLKQNDKKKIVMALGDSYLEGCCSDSMANSYAGFLSNKKEYAFLNFGVAGTDPLQYKLIVEHYAPTLNPDLIVVNVYLGNDHMYYDRTPKPFIPACYTAHNSPWLSSEPPVNIAPPNTTLKNLDEAVEFYKSWYSLTGKTRSGFLKFMGNSVLFSKCYLGIEYNLKIFRQRSTRYRPLREPPFTYNNLKWIADYGKEHGIPVLFVAIPSPVDLSNQVDIRKKYDYFFKELNWEIPTTLSVRDYNGKLISSHFNNSGHKKMAIYLHPLILSALTP